MTESSAGAATEARTFDLRAPQLRQEPLLRSRRRFAWGMVAVAAGFIAFFVGVSVHPIEAGTLPPILFPGLVFIVGVFLFGIYWTFPTRAYLKTGAVQLVSEPDAISLRFSDGSVTRLGWDDPSLAFDLIDLSGVNPSKRLTSDLCSIRVRKVRTILTPEAYEEILHQATVRHLVDGSAPGSRFVFAADADPIFYRVRGRAQTRGSR